MQMLIFKLLVTVILIVAAVHDVKSKGQRVPNYLSLMLMATAVVNPNLNILKSIIGLLVGAGIFIGSYYINVLICKLQKKPVPEDSIGGADVKITGAYGFAIGSWELTLVAAAIAVWGALIRRIILSIIGFIKKDSSIAMKVNYLIPYIAAGCIFCLLMI